MLDTTIRTVNIYSLNPCTDPMRKVLFLSSWTHKDIVVQRGDATCLYPKLVSGVDDLDQGPKHIAMLKPDRAEQGHRFANLTRVLFHWHW
jgi:hypothetical protein